MCILNFAPELCQWVVPYNETTYLKSKNLKINYFAFEQIPEKLDIWPFAGKRFEI